MRQASIAQFLPFIRSAGSSNIMLAKLTPPLVRL